MEKLLQSKKPPSNTSHSLFWWSFKVFSGASLIAALFLQAIYQLPQLFEFPVRLAQLMVIVGGLTSVWHYLKLKALSSDISRPDMLESTHGLFGVIRHPMYLADMLTYSGLFLLFPTIPSVVILLVGLTALVRQAKIEDDFMLQCFGDEFRQWQARTKLILPFIY